MKAQIQTKTRNRERDWTVFRRLEEKKDYQGSNTQLRAEGIADGRGLSATTVRRIVCWLKPKALLRSDDLLRCGCRDVNMILLQPGRQVS
jgi:hypothetical protein